MTISRRTLLARLGAGAAIAVTAPRLGAGSARHGGTIRLNRNENAYGPSPQVIATMQEAASSAVSRYPGGEADALRRRIARFHGVAAEQVVLGCGSGEIVRMAIDAFVGPRRKIVAPAPTFEALGPYALHAGAEVVAVPLRRNFSHDLPAMTARIDAATGLVYICNPNNPTGTLTRRQDLAAFLDRLPSHVVVMIDEAYHDYVEASSDYASFIDRPVDGRVIVTRSFSKIHGLAGMRVGYAVAPVHVARALESQQLFDGVNVVAARAAAAALDDREYVLTSATLNTNDRQEFLNHANARMLRSIDSAANFVLLNTGRPAAAVVEHFRTHGILVSGPVPRFDMYIRVSLGTPAEMREFWRAWDLMPGGHHMSM